jgi:hypothetical protein
MNKMVIVEDSEHAAFLGTEDGIVSVYRKCAGGTVRLLGTGRWEGGIVRGSGVNCGVLVRLEPALRERTGTP